MNRRIWSFNSVSNKLIMQKLLILIILLNRNQLVKCSVIDAVFDQMSGIKSFFIGAFTTIRTSLDDVLEYARGARNVNTNETGPRRVISSVFRNNPLKVLHNRRPEVNVMFHRPAHILTTPQLAATHGRIIETHVTYTLDGYILTLHRLQTTAPKHPGYEQKRRTILLHHGLLGSSADWILLGPKKSLPYILSDEGHDVWLANARGNYYSRAHVSMNFNSQEYWDFSFQDIGERDLPAVLDYIRKTNNSTEPIDYIGHSMGATALLVLLSVEHNYNKYLRIGFLLAPLAFMAHTRGPLEKLAVMDKTELEKLLGTTEFMPTRRTTYSLTSIMCEDLEVYCNNPLFFLTGSPLQEGSKTTEFTDQLQEYVPAGGSAKTIAHYLELVTSKKFHRFGKPDWKYKLKYISTPLLILSSSEDLISDASDNQMLYLSVLNPLGHIIIKDQNFSHSEFAWGFNADLLFYYKIRDLIDLGPDVVKV